MARVDHQERWARSRCTVPDTPLSSTGPMSPKAIPCSCEAAATAWLTSTSPLPRVVSDASREVHGLAEVVALLEEDRPGVQADVGWRQPSGGQPVHHLEGGTYARARIAEVEHHPVAQPLDRLATVPHGAALHQPRDRR